MVCYYSVHTSPAEAEGLKYPLFCHEDRLLKPAENGEWCWRRTGALRQMTLSSISHRGLFSLPVWIKYLISFWCRHTEEGLCPPRVPGHFLSLSLWDRARVTQAMHSHWIHPLLLELKSHAAHTLIPIALCAVPVTGKCVWHLKRWLCVWLCVDAAVPSWSGWWDAGKTACYFPASLSLMYSILVELELFVGLFWFWWACTHSLTYMSHFGWFCDLYSRAIYTVDVSLCEYTCIHIYVCMYVCVTCMHTCVIHIYTLYILMFSLKLVSTAHSPFGVKLLSTHSRSTYDELF